MASFTVTFQPAGRRGMVQEGLTLLQAARDLGVEIESTCGGKGTCHKCRVRIESDPASVSAPTETELRTFGPEAVAAGMRLACQTHVKGNVRIFVPEESRRTTQVVRKEAGAGTVPLDPAVRTYQVTLAPPTLEDATADGDRLTAALAAQYGLASLEFDLGTLQKLPDIMRTARWDLAVRIWNEKVIVDVRGASDPSPLLGLALDVGTTTLAAYLTDLQSGEVLATESAMNPQVAFGDDLIARLYHARRDPEGAAALQDAVISEINALAQRATKRVGATPGDILDVVMAGNTAMHHLFLGLDTRNLSVAPFAPAIHRSLDLKASEVGLVFHPQCRLFALPIEAGFVGADNVAALIATEPYKQEPVVLLIDIGTNGELVLGNKTRMLSTSCATGPAFEGSHIEFGMRAAPGAIERIRVDPTTLDVKFKVIGLDKWSTEYQPSEIGAKGICGSGIIEAAAEMFKAGIILPTGNFNPALHHERILLENGKPRKFVIAWPEETTLNRSITVCLKDIRAIQLAKAALRAGAEILARNYGIARPDKIVLAGAFGTYIDKHAALTIGMLPDCEPSQVEAVGNAAGDGARFALLNVAKRQEAAWVADMVEFVELATDPDFQRLYVQAMSFDPNLISSTMDMGPS